MARPTTLKHPVLFQHSRTIGVLSVGMSPQVGIQIQKSALKPAPSHSDQLERRSDGVEGTCEGNEDACLRHDALNGRLLLKGYPAQHWFQSQRLLEQAHSTGSRSSWRPARSQCTFDPKPKLPTASRPYTERSNIDQLSASRPSVCCFTVTDRAPSFICNSGPQTPFSSSLTSQREGSANEHFMATGGGDRFEVTAIEADAEGSCSVQGSFPDNHRTRLLHVGKQKHTCLRHKATRFQLQQVSTRSLA